MNGDSKQCIWRELMLPCVFFSTSSQCALQVSYFANSHSQLDLLWMENGWNAEQSDVAIWGIFPAFQSFSPFIHLAWYGVKPHNILGSRFTWRGRLSFSEAESQIQIHEQKAYSPVFCGCNSGEQKGAGLGRSSCNADLRKGSVDPIRALWSMGEPFQVVSNWGKRGQAFLHLHRSVLDRNFS